MNREMRYSGIEWIGEIPKEWILARFKYSGCFIKGKLPASQNNEYKGFPIIGASEMLGKEPRLYTEDSNIPMCSDEDILILWDGANAGIIANKCQGIVSSTAVKYSCTDKRFNKQYMFYLLKNAEPFFKSKVGGTTIPHMNTKYIDEYLCILPPLIEQRKIANYFDMICGEVDELTALQEMMIEELKDYKQSVIIEAVTKGLNLNVPMKNSGIDWIGEIPVHWSLHQFRRLFEIKKIIAGALGYDVLSVTQNGIKVKDLSKNEGQIAQDYSKYQIVDVDDYVMNHMDLLTGYVDCSKQVGVTSPDYRVFRAIDKTQISLSYYLKIFQTCYKEKIFYHLGQGVSGMGRWRLPADQLKLFYIPMPPLNEQQSIASYLDEKCSEIDKLIGVKQQKIEKLKDYKKSIIYEAVTGKINIDS